MVCLLFGHKEAPYDLEGRISKAAEKFYQQGFRTFIVGHYGNFDRMSVIALKELKKRHADVCAMLLIPYHPSERFIPVPEGFDGTYYPAGMECVPKKLCIVRANTYMAQICDGCICYVNYPGNTRKLLQTACKRKVPVINIFERTENNCVSLSD